MVVREHSVRGRVFVRRRERACCRIIIRQVARDCSSLNVFELSLHAARFSGTFVAFFSFCFGCSPCRQSVSQLASLELNGVHMHTFKKLLLGEYLFESSLTVVSRHKVNHHSSAVHHKQVDLRREGSRWLAPRPPVTSAAGLVAEAPAVVRGVDGFRQVWDQRQRRHGAIRASGNLEFSTVCVDGMRDFMSMLDYAQLLVHYNI